MITVTYLSKEAAENAAGQKLKVGLGCTVCLTNIPEETEHGWSLRAWSLDAREEDCESVRIALQMLMKRTRALGVTFE